jgi:hypothetical protein
VSTTAGDDGRSDWAIVDGLCQGFFSQVCTLDQVIAVGAAPELAIQTRHQASIAGATLLSMGGIQIESTTVSSDGRSLTARLRAESAGPAMLIIQDAQGHEFDRAELQADLPASLECGAVGPHDRRVASFPDLSTATSTSTTPIPLSASTSQIVLGCRASAADGQALLTVETIHWKVETPPNGVVEVVGDDILAPTTGGAVSLRTLGPMQAVVRATLGSLMQRMAVSFH